MGEKQSVSFTLEGIKAQSGPAMLHPSPHMLWTHHSKPPLEEPPLLLGSVRTGWPQRWLPKRPEVESFLAMVENTPANETEQHPSPAGLSVFCLGMGNQLTEAKSHARHRTERKKSQNKAVRLLSRSCGLRCLGPPYSTKEPHKTLS